MHGVGTRARRDLEDLVGGEVALGCRLAPEGVGLVGEAHMKRVAVELGVHGYGGHPELETGANDPDGDLAPVGDEDLARHGGQSVSMRLPERVRAELSATTRFGDVRLLEEVDSTNRVVADAARGGATEGLVVVADHQ